MCPYSSCTTAMSTSASRGTVKASAHRAVRDDRGAKASAHRCRCATDRQADFTRAARVPGPRHPGSAATKSRCITELSACLDHPGFFEVEFPLDLAAAL